MHTTLVKRGKKKEQTMSRWICIDDICIPSDENDWHELVAFADAVAEQEPIDLVTCAECRHCTHDIVVERSADGYERTINLCRHPKHIEEWSVTKDWYCADGQRRESE